MYRLFVVMDFACTLGIGLLRDDVPTKGLRAIEDVEFRTWLTRHGVTSETLDAPFVTVWYDAVAAYENGDFAHPNLSAGVSVHSIMVSLATYKGHWAYQMRSEVGDTFVAPAYACLRQRGVKFEFFHKVHDIVPGPGNRIEKIVMEKQVSLKAKSSADYEPLIDVGPNKAWPNAPLWAQIKSPQPDPSVDLGSYFCTYEGDMLPALERGQDFDDVIVAMPPGSLETYCPSLLATSKKWNDMAQSIVGVDSQSIRLYFTTTLASRGWHLPTPILSGYAKPFATWEDNGSLVNVETWPTDQTPKSIATLFGPLKSESQSPPPTDTDYPHERTQDVQDNSLKFLTQHTGSLWPGAVRDSDPNCINWSDLIDLKGGSGQARLKGQSIRANVGPLERYTLAKAGTAQYRIGANNTGYTNLSVAGDWTQNSYLIGSVEGAVMSGLMASRAISGYPIHIPGEHSTL